MELRRIATLSLPAMSKATEPSLLIAALLLIAVTAASFYPSFQNGFTNWDDEAHVIQNSVVVNSLSWKTVAKAFSSYQIGHYLPLTMLSYAVEYSLWGPNPLPYHITNLVLHILNSLLVFWLILLLSENLVAALLTAILFAVHPLHVEPVAWVSGRKDLLYSVFFLGALVCYTYSLKKERRLVCLALSWGLFLLSLLSKVMAIPLPFVLPLIDYLSHRKLTWEGVREKVPFLLLAVVFGVIMVMPQNTGVIEKRSFAVGSNVLVAAHGILFYLWKMVLPIKLACLYPFTVARDGGPPWTFLISPIPVAAISVLVYKARTRWRFIPFGFLFFFVTILPVLQILPAGAAVAADRYTYIPSIGLFFLVGISFSWFLRKWKVSRSTLSLAGAVLVIFAVPLLCYLTWQRCHVWKDSITLWTDEISKYDDVGIAYNNRAEAYRKKNDHISALRDLAVAERLQPNYAAIHLNYCYSYQAVGEEAKALASCARALELRPNMAEAYNNLGNLYFRSDKEKALLMYQKATIAEPNNVKAHYSVCSTLMVLGKPQAALSSCRKAAEIDPTNGEIFNTLGSIYLALKDPAEALANYRQAIRFSPDLGTAHNNLAVLYFYSGRQDLAIYHTDKAIKLGHPVHQEFLQSLKPYRK
jgi:protein O-mannosyl-transferase